MTTVNDPKGEAGSKKAPMWLLPPVALEQTAWVAKLGAEKYGPFNWRKTGVCATTYVSAIMRHLNAWRDGEDLDPESGLSHIAHIATSCNILMDAEACGTLQDDRNKRPGAGISGLGFRVYPDVEIGLEAYLDAADRELLRTASEDSPCAEQLRRVFAPVAETGVEATPGALTREEAFRKLVGSPPSVAVKVVDHDIKPGDQVRILLMHFTDAFPATIKNVVDIRGEKVYTTTSGSHYAESEIYSITHA